MEIVNSGTKNKTQKFGDKEIRTVWEPKKKKLWFCVMDMTWAIARTKDAKDYLKKLRKRDKELAEKWESIIKPFPYKTKGGLQNINFADKEGIIRITKKIPSASKEAFHAWVEDFASQDFTNEDN